MLKRIFGRYWYFWVALVMIIIFIGNASTKDTLNVYSDGDASYTVEMETEKEKTVPSFSYTNGTINLQLQIPEGWQRITKDGYDTFVHSASASSIQVQVLGYYPMVNNTTSESMSETCASRGFKLTEFETLAGNSYCAIYQSQGLSGITDYIEYVVWDRSHVVKLVVTVNDEYYDRLQDEIWSCIDSLSWEYESPIPENCYLYYQSYGDFEHAVPNGWVTGSTEDAFYAYDDATDAVLTINVLEDPSYISDISQLDYAGFLSNGKSNFALTKFEQSENSIYGEATYMSGDVQMGLMQSYLANGTYHYIVTYEFPLDYADQYLQQFQKALQATRVFYVSAEPATEAETEGFEAMTAQWEPETFLERMSGLGQDFMEEGSDVPTFADAIVTVAGVSEDQAAEAVQAWEAYGAGDPVYADAYSKTADGTVILITDVNDMQYLMAFDPDGNFAWIEPCVE